MISLSEGNENLFFLPWPWMEGLVLLSALYFLAINEANQVALMTLQRAEPPTEYDKCIDVKALVYTENCDKMSEFLEKYEVPNPSSEGFGVSA